MPSPSRTRELVQTDTGTVSAAKTVSGVQTFTAANTFSTVQTFAITATASDSKAINITSAPTLVSAGVRQGALAIDMDRAATAALTSWDGNPDCAIKITATNRANNGSNGGARGLDLLARNRDSTGNQSWVNGALITAEHRTGAGTLATDVIGLEVHAKNNAVCSGNVKCLRVYDESQSGTGTSYAIEINCTNDSAFTREYCIYINSGASSAWTNGLTFDGNITNALDFADTDGTNGATYSAGHYASLGNVDGKIKVDIGGNTLYIPAYASIA